MDVSRRGILGLISSLSTVYLGPANAIRNTAISAATTMMASQGAIEASASGSSWKFDIKTPLGQAERILDRETMYHTRGDVTPRASISCFKSASTTSKMRWEKAAMMEDRVVSEIAEKALKLLREGKLSIL